jgi:hypothetical protein
LELQYTTALTSIAIELIKDLKKFDVVVVVSFAKYPPSPLQYNKLPDVWHFAVHYEDTFRHYDEDN